MIPDIKLLKNKNVLITGASGGIGEELCNLFDDAGSNIFAVGRNSEKLNSLSKKINNIEIYQCDFTSPKSIFELNKKIHDDSNGVDILINNAGFFSTVSIEDVTLEEYEKSFTVNVCAPILMTSFHCKNMKEKRWGRIFNIGSSSAYSGGNLTSLYCSAKHALLGFSRSISEELRDYNVRVCNLSPSSTQTPMGKIPLATHQDYETFISPHEVARVLIFLSAFDSNMEIREVLLNRVSTQ